MSGTPLAPERPPPLLAQHTLQVLRERLALDDAAVARLASEGVIGVRQP
jgi:crotonobetainyl-CoA:carnitine CoA-transferase CaiB-like acyl-CoA transferase